MLAMFYLEVLIEVSHLNTFVHACEICPSVFLQQKVIEF